MPLWKIYHPVGAFTAEDKHAFAQTISDLYAKLPLPKFYVKVSLRNSIGRAPTAIGGCSINFGVMRRCQTTRQ